MVIVIKNGRYCGERRFVAVSVSSYGIPKNVDDVIRKRLLFEAEGTSGDDRRINSLLKTFMRWCNAKDSGTEER